MHILCKLVKLYRLAMARVVALDELDHKLKQCIVAKLRSCDDATVLPQAHRSPESGVLKGVVLRLDGSVDGLDPEIFNPSWFSGVSVIHFPADKAETILANPAKRSECIRKLADSIPSELKDSQIQVGPELDGGEEDQDVQTWEFGFDSPGCCVGLYSAFQSCPPDVCLSGMNRAYKSYFLVCKAGAGIAGQTFHARLCASLKSGKTLDESLSDDGVPGARALRRVGMAARRNRGRILHSAAQCLGFHSVDTIGDNASPLSSLYRVAIPNVDVVYNALVHTKVTTDRWIWQYTSGCVEESLSLGCLASSNVGEGFVLFTPHNSDLRYTVRNEAHNSIPFGTQRLLSNRDVMFKSTDEHKKHAKSKEPVHPDDAWIRSHFAWDSKTFITNQTDIEPSCLWGSHGSENFVSDWSRELGLSKSRVVRLCPEAVALAAPEPGKLRVAVRAVEREGQDRI